MNDLPISINGAPVLVRPQRCGNCKWHMPVAREPMGECHRHPPTSSTLLAPGSRGEPSLVTNTSFPRVQPEWFCGEWLLKIEL